MTVIKCDLFFLLKRSSNWRNTSALCKATILPIKVVNISVSPPLTTDWQAVAVIIYCLAANLTTSGSSSPPVASCSLVWPDQTREEQRYSKLGSDHGQCYALQSCWRHERLPPVQGGVLFTAAILQRPLRPHRNNLPILHLLGWCRWQPVGGGDGDNLQEPPHYHQLLPRVSGHRWHHHAGLLCTAGQSRTY